MEDCFCMIEGLDYSKVYYASRRSFNVKGEQFSFSLYNKNLICYFNFLHKYVLESSEATWPESTPEI